MKFDRTEACTMTCPTNTRSVVLMYGNTAVEFDESKLRHSIRVALIQGVLLPNVEVEGTDRETGEVVNIILVRSKWHKCM